MNQYELCGKAITEIMREKPYAKLSIDDLQFFASVICQLNINELKLAFLRLNKHTKTGSLSFTYTDNIIKGIREKNEDDLKLFIMNRDWPEVYDNPDLTVEEMDALEKISIEETKLVRNALYKAMIKENKDRCIFTTCDTRREVVKGKNLSIYEDCYNLCFEKRKKEEIDVPNYLSNIVPIERKVSKAYVEVKTEVCYSFYDVLKHLYVNEHTGARNLELSYSETKIVRETLDLEYRIYNNYMEFVNQVHRY